MDITLGSKEKGKGKCKRGHNELFHYNALRFILATELNMIMPLSLNQGLISRH